MPIPSISEDELLHVLGQLLFIKNDHPDAITKPAALTLLKKSLARGRLFRSFDQGPPQRLHGQPPLELDAQATAGPRWRLMLYALLCTSVDKLGLSEYPSRLWDSIYSAVPVVLEWIYFLHPMNGNIRKIDDAAYNFDVASVIINLLEGIVRPRIMKDNALADWLKATRLDVHIVDFFVNLRRYVPEPTYEMVDDTLAWTFLLCAKLRPGVVTFVVPHRMHEITEILGYSSRRFHRAIFGYLKLVRERGWDYEKSAHKLFLYAFSIDSAIPALQYVPDDIVASTISEIKFAADLKAYRVAEAGCKYLHNLWANASGYHVYEASISGGVFDVLVHLAKTLPAIPRTKGLRDLVRGFLWFLSQVFVYWRPLSSFHLKHGSDIAKNEASLLALGPGFVEFLTVYKERYIFLENTRRKRLDMRKHCRACCLDKGGEGKCCTEPERTKLLRCQRCQDVSYCSVECQRAHWRSTHRKDCQPLPVWCNARDKSFITCITTAYLCDNAQALNDEITKMDPDHRYHCAAYLFFTAPGARLNVDIVRECEPGEPCIVTVSGVFEEYQESSTKLITAFNRKELEDGGWFRTRRVVPLSLNENL
ncbi:hypothetical protein EV715DRAFT_212445 [Schizophyllum commune]